MKRASTFGKEKSNVTAKEPTWDAAKLQQKGECAEVNSTRTQEKD